MTKSRTCRRILWIAALGASAVFGMTSCKSNFSRANPDSPLLAIRQMVYADGWKQCGLVTVLTNGSYTWLRQDIWKRDAPDRIDNGRLPSAVFESLGSFVRDQRAELNRTNTVVTYVHYIDDTEPKPKPIQVLLDFLNTTHPITDAAEDKTPRPQ